MCKSSVGYHLNPGCSMNSQGVECLNSLPWIGEVYRTHIHTHHEYAYISHTHIYIYIHTCIYINPHSHIYMCVQNIIFILYIFNKQKRKCTSFYWASPMKRGFPFQTRAEWMKYPSPRRKRQRNGRSWIKVCDNYLLAWGTVLGAVPIDQPSQQPLQYGVTVPLWQTRKWCQRS